MKSRKDVDKPLHLVSPRRVGAIVFLVLVSTAYVEGSQESTAPFASLLDVAAQLNGGVSLPRLHVEGNQIKDENGQLIILRGVNKPQHAYSVVGNWAKVGGDYISGNRDFDINDVRVHLQAMKARGCNLMRLFISLKWWKEPDQWWWSKLFNYKQLIKDTIQAASEEGLYVLVVLNGILGQDCHSPAGGLPFPPYLDAEELAVIPDKQTYLGLVFSVANELKAFPNVLLGPWNEPWGDAHRVEWQQTVEAIVAQLRAASIDMIVVVEWLGYRSYSPVDYDFSFFRTNPISGTNIIYDVHMYRGGFLGKPYTYTDVKNRLHAEQIDVATVPLIIGECGVDRWATGQEYQNELTYLTNLLKVLNEWKIGYAAYSWQNERPLGDPIENGQFAVLKDEPAIPTLSETGRILMNSIQGDTTSTTTTTLQTTTTSTSTSLVTTTSPVTTTTTTSTSAATKTAMTTSQTLTTTLQTTSSIVCTRASTTKISVTSMSTTKTVSTTTTRTTTRTTVPHPNPLGPPYPTQPVLTQGQQELS